MSIVDEYFDIKEQSNSDLLAMQVGDFYEFFGDDARKVSNELGLKLSEKSSHGSSHSMAGVPINDIDQYVHNLVDKMDYTVTIADQYKEDGEHKREITRTVTPGTLVNNFGGEPKYLASVYVMTDEDVGISLTDVTSGRIIVTKCNKSSVLKNLSVYDPSEILIDRENVNINISDITESIESYFDTKLHTQDRYPDYMICKNVIKEHFGENIIDSVDISAEQVVSASMILNYLKETGKDTENSITKIQKIGNEDYVKMDARTRRSLEIINTMSFDSGISLFEVMDETLTSMGSDLLKRYLQRPLTSESKIKKRQDSVELFTKNAVLRDNIREQLEITPNIQRITSRAANGTATPKDVCEIVDTIDSVDEISDLLNSNDPKHLIYSKFKQIDIDEIRELYSKIRKAFVDNPPGSVQSGMISYGYDDELDQVIDDYNKNKEWIENLEDKLSNEYGLSHISIGRNKTDGYYIQVGNSEEDDVPNKYSKIKSLKSSVRFKNDEIEQKEREIIRLEEKREEMERKIFKSIIDEVAKNSEYLQDMGDSIAYIDTIQSIAVHSVKNSWIKPTIRQSDEDINIKKGRHPVVEQTVDFIPNNCSIGDERQMLIVTGPNMAGKSTYLRQTALIVLLSQIGSYVPATEAKIGIVDGIFTRIGSLDEISQGRSTFMVEMSELANILHRSTNNSLVILDEVGRGTATYDGLSIAQSTIEYLTQSEEGPEPLTLFATHYHELTELSESIDSIENVHVAVESSKNDYKFLRKVKKGAADKSYGIKVADMAGVPEPVISRSEDIIDDMNSDNS